MENRKKLHAIRANLKSAWRMALISHPYASGAIVVLLFVPIAAWAVNSYVGIGTTTPIHPLHVQSSASAIEGIYGADTSQNGLNIGASFTNRWSIYQDVAPGRMLGIWRDHSGAGGSTGAVMSFLDNGNVGIGTTTPSYPLVVSSGTGTWASVIVGNYGVLGEANVAGNVGAEGYNTASGTYGQLGSAYGVYGQGASNNWAGYFTGGYGAFGNSNVAGQYGIEGANSASGTWTLLGYSSYGIYCGAGTCGGPVGWTNTSDERLKEGIHPITGALAKILELNGVFFHWKDKKRDKSEGEKIGLIAQNVEKVFPQAVQTHTDDLVSPLPGGTKMLTYTDLIAPLINAVKELYQVVTQNDASLRRELAEAKDGAAKDKARMQSEVEELRAEVASLRAYLCEKNPSSPLCDNH